MEALVVALSSSLEGLLAETLLVRPYRDFLEDFLPEPSFSFEDERSLGLNQALQKSPSPEEADASSFVDADGDDLALEDNQPPDSLLPLREAKNKMLHLRTEE